MAGPASSLYDAERSLPGPTIHEEVTFLNGLIGALIGFICSRATVTVQGDDGKPAKIDPARARPRLRSIGLALPLAATIAGSIASAQAPDSHWIEAFGYGEAAVHSVDIGDFGFPHVAVRIGDTRLRLPFDTGNTVGLSVSSALFNQLQLTAEDHYDRLNSAGESVATLRVAHAREVSVLGRDVGPTRIYELDHPSLAGLVGPDLIGGGHFTIDYSSRRMAVGSGSLPDAVPGFRQVPLVRSNRHPTLILVRGTVEDREVLIELDTGKSRTVINPVLSSDLGLRRDARGVAIEHLRIGDLLFEVPSAKEVDQSAIDTSLPEPILAGVGSDVLSRFVWTVDYEAGLLWIPVTRRSPAPLS